MPNIKSQKKRVKTNEIRRQRNVTVRSRVKTYVKKVEDAIEAGDAEAVKLALPEALSEIDKAASKGVIHQNTSGRKKSSLTRRATASQKS